MSSFVGIVRWSDHQPLPHHEADRLRGAAAHSGKGPATVLSAPPAHVAFCQKITNPEDRWERQPATAGDIISMFDGRIDGREELAERLGMSLDGVPDGALALAAFRRWGADAPREVLGEFAWAVWDGSARRLMLARDISVSRTLYVYRSDRLIAFATGLRALFSLTEVPREVDEQGLAEIIALHPGQGERTTYLNVSRVMPGTTLIVDQHGQRHASNWEPRPVSVPREPMECAEAVREIFARATKDRIRSIGPTAISLSGGLDSAIVAAQAAQCRSPDPVLGIFLAPRDGVPLAVWPGMTADGRPQVAALARAHPNLRVELVDSVENPIDINPTAMFMGTCQPVWLAPNLGWLLSGWRTAAASGARLIMAGDDGEMSLTHYGSARAMIKQGDVLYALREIWHIYRHQGRGLPGLLDRAFLGGFLTRLRKPDLRTKKGNWRCYSPIHPDLAQSARVRDLLLAENFPGGLQSRPPGYAEFLRIALRWRALGVENVAALRHLTGLDHTCPMADRRILEFCLSLPERMFCRGGRQRWLARTAFRDILPPEVRDNVKKGAQNPEWFHRLTLQREAMHRQFESIQTSALANRALDIPRLKALLDRWPASAEEADAAGPAYRSTLVRGLHVGAFLRWLDTSNGA